MKLNELLPGVGRAIGFYPAIAIVIGTDAAILLSQLCYWDGKQRDPSGWIYKTLNELVDETGLSLKRVKTAKQKLADLNLIDVFYNRPVHKLHMRVNQESIIHMFKKYSQSP